jgi:formylglycine-generating enzyme
MSVSLRSRAPAKHMVWVPGGPFAIGSEDFYPEEAPVREISVDGFWMDEHPVTVAEFRRFVDDTGHVTLAERAPAAADYPDAELELLVPGSLVFRPTRGPVDLNDYRNWWNWTPGAYWRRPEGPESNAGGRELHPVVHIAYADALAYAHWAGKELPGEAEWERAARGGLDRKVYAWGDEFAPKGRIMANTWQGEFPWQNLMNDGFAGTSPIRRFAPNGFGLYDMTGNTWEWTSDCFSAQRGPAQHGCCAPQTPRGGAEADSCAEGERIPRKTIKGGSHLCAPNYCLRYRPAARQGETVETSASHMGFRCIVRAAPAPGQD